MRPLQPLRLPKYLLRYINPSLRSARWLHKSSVRHCSCTNTREKPGSQVQSILRQPVIASADHRVLGTSLDLFSNSIYSPGSPFFHPDGAHIFHKLQSFLRAQYPRYGLREVITPTIYKKSLWEQSGHWENYKDDMYEVVGRGASGETQKGEIGENEEYGLKPMNCPGHCLLFKSQKRSYRDLPMGYADFSPLHRNEISGALSGLTRVRRFHQDDGHIFCRPNQVESEILKTLKFVNVVYNTFGLGSYRLVLSTRPRDHFIGSIGDWDRAESQLTSALKASGQSFSINAGDGAFYGPKIDIILSDSDGKQHQTATIQLDFQLPQRFGLTYQAPTPEFEIKGQETTDTGLLVESGDVAPVMIHRAVLGSFERFMALLIEHYQGHWPLWLSPRQAIILTIGQDETTLNFAAKSASTLSGIEQEDTGKPLAMQGHRFVVNTDFSARSISKKLAEAKAKHYNFICVVGAKEAKSKTLKVDVTGQFKNQPVEKVANQIREQTLSGLAGRSGNMADEMSTNVKALTYEVDDLKELMTSICEDYL